MDNGPESNSHESNGVTVSAAPDAIPEAVPVQSAPSGMLPKGSVLRNRFGHLRAGWRLSIYFIAVVIVSSPTMIVLHLLLADVSVAEDSLIALPQILFLALCTTILILVAFAVLKWIDRRPLSLLGLDLRGGWLRELLLGLMAGIVLVSVPAALLVATGSVSLVLTPDPLASLASLPMLLVFLLLAGALEEVLFRGYLLQVLAEGSRRWLAAGSLSLLFTIVHLGNPDVMILPVINIFLAGILLSVAYYKTLRLWLPIGLHVSWNVAQSWLWGFDLSGVKLDHTLLVVQPRGSDLLSGGEFGLEGSLLATIAIALVIAWLLWSSALRPTAETTARWAPYPRGFGLVPQ